MAVPFGFSIIDFVAVLKLLYDIYACIGPNARVSKEIQLLSTYIRSLYESAESLNSVLLDENIHLEGSVTNALEFHLEQCRLLLEEFLTRVKRPPEPRSSRNLGIDMKNVVERFTYKRDVGQNVGRLMQSFKDQVEAFQLNAAIVTASKQKQMHRSIETIRAGNKTFESTLAQLLRMWGDMPRELGYTWEGGELKAQITLFHATGEQKYLPLEVCETPENLKKYLLIESTFPGRKRIERGHYELTDYATGQKISNEDIKMWKNIIRPGSKILLSVMVGTAIYAKICNDICPRCDSKRLSNLPFHPWKRCSDCDLDHDKTTCDEWNRNGEPIDSETWDWFPVKDRLLPGHPMGEEKSECSPADSQKCKSENGIDRHSQSSTDEVQTLRESVDLEERLKRVVLVYSPIYNFVFRNAICHCRLGGDSSPFAPNFDFLIFTPCRLHLFDEAVAQLKLNLEHPEDGYDPRRDPYFGKFGGYLAFAIFIYFHPVVLRSIDVRKLIREDELEEAVIQYKHAQENDACWTELLKSQEELAQNYFKWREKHKEEQERRVKACKSDTKNARRGSF